MAAADTTAADAIARTFREEHGQAVATLTRRFGDLDVAEESVQEAFAVALRRWPNDGVPPNPGGWITTTAKRKALDRLRRESSRSDREARAVLAGGDGPDEPAETDEEVDVRDDRLRLLFTCCHPALNRGAQVALTLRLLGGLQTPEIARAFLVPEPTMAQRLVRAKKKIRAANIPYRVPSGAELPDRLPPVLAVVYLVFNEGHLTSSGATLVRDDLCVEAIRLARLLVELMPDEPEVHGLLALLLLLHARRATRTDAAGALVPLGEQHRPAWDAALIAEGHDLVRRCLRRNQPGPYQIQAAIQAVHTDAPAASATDWAQIVALYDQLLRFTPSPVVHLNRAVAVAERDGPSAGLAALDAAGLGATSSDLDGYHLLHAVRADLLTRTDDVEGARRAYATALGLVENETERRFLQDRLTLLVTEPDDVRPSDRKGGEVD